MIALLLAAQLATSPAQDRLDHALLIGGLSASSVALGLTMVCTTAGTCGELNPILRPVIGRQPLRATVVRSAVMGGVYYAVWQGTHGRPRTRTLALLACAGINGVDAIHDVRVMRKLGYR